MHDSACDQCCSLPHLLPHPYVSLSLSLTHSLTHPRCSLSAGATSSQQATIMPVTREPGRLSFILLCLLLTVVGAGALVHTVQKPEPPTPPPPAAIVASASKTASDPPAPATMKSEVRACSCFRATLTHTDLDPEGVTDVDERAYCRDSAVLCPVSLRPVAQCAHLADTGLTGHAITGTQLQ